MEGHSSAHIPQPLHSSRFMAMPSGSAESAFSGQDAIQVLHPMHLFSIHCICGLREMLSGLWHHWHASPHPLKNTVVRMPGPSSVDILWMLSTVAASCFSFSKVVIGLSMLHVFNLTILQYLLWLSLAIISS